MGYKKVPVIHTLNEIEGEDGLVVRLKSVSFGKVRKLMRLTSDDSDDSMMDEIAVMFQDALVSWNLEDEEGPVPTTVEAVENQDFDFVMKIVHAWLDRMTGPGEELGKDSSGGERFPGRPLTMEAL
jgi:hypothetical protein